MIESKDDLTPENLKAELDSIATRVDCDTLQEAERFPQFFQLETMRHCNARCPFCAIDLWDKSHPLMTDKLFDKVVEEMKDHKDWIRLVDIQRAGEPLLDKKIAPRVRALKDAGLRFVTLTTNAALLDEKRGTALLESGIDEVMISIDSVDRENYVKMRVGLDYDEVMANIQNFFALRERVKPDTIVRVRGVSLYDLDNAEHQAEMERWENFWGPFRKPHDRIYLKQAHNWGNQVDSEGIEVKGDVYHPCVVPWSTMHITAMGTVALCPQDFDAKANLGDINTQSIAEVWRGEKFQELRRLHSTGERNQISFCQGCRLFDPEFSLEKSETKGQFHIKVEKKAAVG